MFSSLSDKKNNVESRENGMSFKKQISGRRPDTADNGNSRSRREEDSLKDEEGHHCKDREGDVILEELIDDEAETAEFRDKPEANLFALSNPRATRSKLPSKPYSIPRARDSTYRRPPFIEPAPWYADQAGPAVIITFDAFDTLYTPKEPIPYQYAMVAREFGHNYKSITPEKIDQTFRDAYKSVSADFPNQGQEHGMAPYAWWKRVITRTFMPLLPEKNPKKAHSQIVNTGLVHELYTRFSSSEGYHVFPDVWKFLTFVGRSYQARNWPPRRTMLGVISNSDPRVRSVLKSFTIPIRPAMFPPRFTPMHAKSSGPAPRKAHFAFATLSYECGFEKPDQEIYRAALKDAQTTLDQMPAVGRLTRSGKDLLSDVETDFHRMHVGDDLKKDVIPAIKAGWDGILLDRTAEQPVSERPVEDEEGIVKTVTIINGLDKLRQLVTREKLEAKMAERPRKAVEQGQRPARALDSLPNQDHSKPLISIPHPLRGWPSS